MQRHDGAYTPRMGVYNHGEIVLPPLPEQVDTVRNVTGASQPGDEMMMVLQDLGQALFTVLLAAISEKPDTR